MGFALSFICMTIAFFVGWFSHTLNNKLNSKYLGLNDKIRNIEFKIVKIEECSSKGSSNNYVWIAKYTIESWYATGKNDVEHVELVFFDERGKYNIGDTLTITKT